nr:unnamed protein product [Digitaria exilis]
MARRIIMFRVTKSEQEQAQQHEHEEEEPYLMQRSLDLHVPPSLPGVHQVYIVPGVCAAACPRSTHGSTATAIPPSTPPAVDCITPRSANGGARMASSSVASAW